MLTTLPKYYQIQCCPIYINTNNVNKCHVAHYFEILKTLSNTYKYNATNTYKTIQCHSIFINTYKYNVT